MQKVFLSLSIIMSIFISHSLLGQSSDHFPYVEQRSHHKFIQCAAVLHNGKVLVDTYSTAGKCRITGQLNGTLSVSTISFDPEGEMLPVAPINFRLAIKNDKSHTLWMFSHEIYKEINLSDLMPFLNNGDKIVFLTTDDIYSLPHHEVEILGGC